MPKISEEKRQARRDQILAASWRCFSRRGLHATSMEDIIREADVSLGAVYLYYKSKDELILAAFSAAFQQMQALVGPILATDDVLPPPAFFREITRIVTDHAKRDDLDFGVAFLMGWSQAQFSPEIKDLIGGGQQRYLGAITRVVRKWQERGDLSAEGDPESVAKVLFSMVLGFIVQSAMIGGLDLETVCQGVQGLLQREGL